MSRFSMFKAPFNLGHWDLQNKWVLVRIDGNVPIKNNEIVDDSRLRCMRQTLIYIKERGGKCIILTHRGRPQQFEASLSTQILTQWFEQNGFTTRFAREVSQISSLKQLSPDCIIVENIRFFELLDRTEQNDFYEELAQNAHYYVFDGWGVAHRADTSLTVLPRLFLPEKRSIGFCVLNELEQLQSFKTSDRCMMILGGGKGEEKLQVVTKISNLKKLIVLPAVSKIPLNDGEYVFSIKRFGTLKDSLSELNAMLEPAMPLLVNGLTPYDDQLGFDTLVENLQMRTGKTLVSGGDTVAALRSKLHNATFSTGGGSTLSYLADMCLPAVDALSHD